MIDAVSDGPVRELEVTVSRNVTEGTDLMSRFALH